MPLRLPRAVALGFILCFLAACGSQTALPPSEANGIIFDARPIALQPGECSLLNWEAPAGVGATLNGEPIPMLGQREVCPPETLAYELVVDMGTRTETRRLQITVGGTAGPSAPSEPTGLSEPISPGIPAYQAGSWVATGGPPGGLGYDIRMRPDNPDVMFVTDAHAGVSKSVDGGRTWFPSNEGIQKGIGNDVPIFCLTIDPHDYDVIWSGTQLIGHVYRSDDNGASWVEMDSGINQRGRSIRGITIDPNHPEVVYAASEVDASVWEEEAHQPGAYGTYGEVYKSTDGGQSWIRIWSGENIARYIWVDPRDSLRIYVSTGIFDRAAANSTPESTGGVGILRSEDGGQSWTVLNESNGLSGLIVPSLFMHPENPDILVAAVSNPGIGGVFVSVNGGDTWTRMTAGPTASDAVEIALSDPNIWYSATEGSISRSDDAGQTWETFSLATPDRTAGMPIDLQVDPRDPFRIFDNNYGGGNFLSTDGGQTWVDASKGYTGATIAGMLVSPKDASDILVGANTGGFHSTDGGDSWPGTGLSSATQILDTPEGLIVGDAGGNIWHSLDQGGSWVRTPVVDLSAEMEAGRMDIDVASMRALVAAPSHPTVLYTGFNNPLCLSRRVDLCLSAMPNMYRSADGGHSWQELLSTPFANQTVLSIAVHPDDSQKLYAATITGLFLSMDGGASWEKVESFNDAVGQIPVVDSGDPIAQFDLRVVTDVVFDPFNPQLLYAASLQGAVWRSRDGGETWDQAAAGMDPNELVVKLLPDPGHPQLIYAASTFSGVFVTLDGGEVWQSINDGLDSRNITNLALSADGSVLYAGTGASGVFRLGGTPVESP